MQFCSCSEPIATSPNQAVNEHRRLCAISMTVTATVTGFLESKSNVTSA